MASIFTRESTGFVREVSILDALFANVGFMAIPLGLLTFIVAPYIFPGGDVILATLFATLLSVFVALMYALFVWMMPKTGGDYIWVSRALHPVVGFAVNFNLTFWYVFFGGIVTAWVTSLGLSPAILVVGTITSNQYLVSLGNTLAQPVNVVIVGALITLVNASVMVRGAKTALRLNNVMVLLSMAGYVIDFALLVTSNNAQFVSAFDKFGSYQGIISAAHGIGYSATGSNFWYATLGLMPYIFGTTGYGYITAYFSGEMKGVKKNAFYSQVGSVLLTGGILGVLGALAIKVFGYEFLGSINALATAGSSQYPFAVPPFFNLFVSMLTTNQVILWVLVLTFFASFFVALPPTYMLGTRNIFAWSFDRVLPERFAYLQTKYNSPLLAIIVIALIELGGLVATEFGPPSYVALVSGAGFAELLSLIVVAIVGIVFPFRKKELFKGSAADIRVAGIPILTIASIISLFLFITIEYYYLSNPLYGANILPVYELTAFSIILPVFIFVVSYYYHRSKNIDIMQAYRAIPPD